MTTLTFDNAFSIGEFKIAANQIQSYGLSSNKNAGDSVSTLAVVWINGSDFSLHINMAYADAIAEINRIEDAILAANVK